MPDRITGQRDQSEGDQPWLTGQGLYERASDRGAVPWDELSYDGRQVWARAERVLSDGLSAIVDRSMAFVEKQHEEKN